MSDNFLELPENFNQEEFLANVRTLREFLHFAKTVYLPMHDEYVPKFKQMVYRAFPHFVGIKDPIYVNFFESVGIIELVNHSLYFNELVKKFKQGVNLQELHGKEKLDRWRAFYYAPPQHGELTDADRNPYLPQTDAEWAAYKEKENEYHNLFFAHEQWKEKIYTTTINNILLHFYPIIADFEGDYWLLYAMHLKDSYCKHKEYMDYIECNWDYDMPSSMLELSKEAYFEAFQSYAKDKRKQVEQKIRNRVLAWHELQKSAPTSQK